jgi:hypothetical protein
VQNLELDSSKLNPSNEIRALESTVGDAGGAWINAVARTQLVVHAPPRGENLVQRRAGSNAPRNRARSLPENVSTSGATLQTSRTRLPGGVLRGRARGPRPPRETRARTRSAAFGRARAARSVRVAIHDDRSGAPEGKTPRAPAGRGAESSRAGMLLARARSALQLRAGTLATVARKRSSLFICLSIFLDRVEHRRVVAAAEEAADLLERVPRDPAREVHRDLARERDRRGARATAGR